MSRDRIELFHDHFQNYKLYNIPKAQLVLTDIPYNVGVNAYGSSPQWYVGGDNKNGASKLAGKAFFDTDHRFKTPEFLHFCTKMMRPEPKERNAAPAMIVFCSFEQQFMLIEEAKKHGLNRYINLVFYKNFSPQVLKANMRVVGNCEYALLLYRDKLPKFRGRGSMVFNALPFPRDNDTPKVHPTQKPLALMERLIDIFTDEDDVVIDPLAGSGVTLLAAKNMNRRGYGFEIKRQFVKDANEKILPLSEPYMFTEPEQDTEAKQGILL